MTDQVTDRVTDPVADRAPVTKGPASGGGDAAGNHAIATPPGAGAPMRAVDAAPRVDAPAHTGVDPMPHSTERTEAAPDAQRSAPREVTFRTAPDQGGERVAVVGEFNDWSISTHPMVRRGDHFELVVRLAPGRYRFRYLVDGHRWENDWRADAYEPNAFGGEDSVVEVPADDMPEQPVVG